MPKLFANLISKIIDLSNFISQDISNLLHFRQKHLTLIFLTAVYKPKLYMACLFWGFFCGPQTDLSSLILYFKMWTCLMCHKKKHFCNFRRYNDNTQSKRTRYAKSIVPIKFCNYARIYDMFYSHFCSRDTVTRFLFGFLSHFALPGTFDLH